jgi:hypothetical protein
MVAIRQLALPDMGEAGYLFKWWKSQEYLDLN